MNRWTGSCTETSLEVPQADFGGSKPASACVVLEPDWLRFGFGESIWLEQMPYKPVVLPLLEIYVSHVVSSQALDGWLVRFFVAAISFCIEFDRSIQVAHPQPQRDPTGRVIAGGPFGNIGLRRRTSRPVGMTALYQELQPAAIPHRRSVV